MVQYFQSGLSGAHLPVLLPLPYLQPQNLLDVAEHERYRTHVVSVVSPPVRLVGIEIEVLCCL